MEEKNNTTVDVLENDGEVMLEQFRCRRVVRPEASSWYGLVLDMQ